MKRQKEDSLRFLKITPIIAWLSAFSPVTVGAQPSLACDTPSTSFCDSKIAVPTDWNGHVFHMSQNYPTSLPNDAQPWKQFDPTTQPAEYIKVALAYFYEGNVRGDVETSFEPTLNKVRKWFTAPWQDFGINGREPIHGLTRERVSLPLELDPYQTSRWNNYAIGFYNGAGGFTLGRIWQDHGKPDASLGNLPDGTVAGKLLFTTASISEAPYLEGAPEWDAYICADVHDPAPKPDSPRAVVKVRLLQIDIAVKDSRVASTTGWVFGTFVYGGGPGGSSGTGWTNVSPVGLMWGNDPDHFNGGTLTQTWLNPAVNMPHVGLRGRLNGPVDNKVSSCMSCHATAESPEGVMVAPTGMDAARWFRNIPAGTPFDAGRQSLDYSLQISVGLRNFQAAKALAEAPNVAARQALTARFLNLSVRPPRDGGLLD